MEAFWCITLSIIVIRAWWKHQPDGPPVFKFKRKNKIQPVNFPPPKSQAELQRERDVADLKNQGYSDEVIATILPVINNGG